MASASSASGQGACDLAHVERIDAEKVQETVQVDLVQEFVTTVDPRLPEVRMIRPRRHGDARGFFMETYNLSALAAAGITDVFVQDNLSLSQSAGTVRGLHFQTPPFAQAKLVRCSRGRLLDVAVDVRTGSPSYGRYVAAELSAENASQLFIPAGFAHGFVTLEPGTEIQYKVSAPYSAAHDAGILWCDPALDIPWPVSTEAAVLSEKDRRLPRLADYNSPFRYEPQATSS